MCYVIKADLIFKFYLQKSTKGNTIKTSSRSRVALEHGITVQFADVSVESKAAVTESDADKVLVRILGSLPDVLVGEATSTVAAKEEGDGEHPEGHRVCSDLLLLRGKLRIRGGPSLRFISSDRPEGGCHFLHCCCRWGFQLYVHGLLILKINVIKMMK